MLEFEGVVGIALLALWIFAIFDVIASDAALVRNLPKMVWLLIVLFLPDIGSIAWLILGRPANARFVPGSSERRASPPGAGGAGRRTAPAQINEDAPEFMRDLEQRRLRAWEDSLREREEDLRRRERGDDA